MKTKEQKSNIDQHVVKRSYFDLMITWLEECRGKKAMIYLFCWMTIPLALGFLGMITALFSICLSLLFLFLAMGIFIFMTIGLFMMLILLK